MAKKGKTRHASMYSVRNLEREIADKASIEIGEILHSMECDNSDCHDENYEKQPSRYGIRPVITPPDFSSVIFMSSEWCCNNFMNKVEGECYRQLSSRFSSDDVVVTPTHFVQE